jgi:hypothetical protein
MRARGLLAAVREPGRPRGGGIDELLARMAERAQRRAGERAGERAAAAALAAEPRFWTLGLAERLLEAAEAAGAEEPERLPELALAIVRQLPVERYGESLLVERLGGGMGSMRGGRSRTARSLLRL